MTTLTRLVTYVEWPNTELRPPAQEGLARIFLLADDDQDTCAFLSDILTDLEYGVGVA